MPKGWFRPVKEGFADFRHAVAIGVTQQRDAVGALAECARAHVALDSG